ncbi:undecaprenyldiphospho-muramoylpentapeptide beta-N-acetylglucosaminyltransferase [Allofustis seminis]|uniref:undecaprenyldiphospho-muramoylpentapeptide beta-N-acetylglucosaminyltransferase n=1 Tax=Allofustis seminis TaxID=166939 RepID=UPI0003778547|nr:undecaprenyldiphospho-muramoylpentapeptide beta-N-acetylglucosaminyltransferase [Allofustis seminis]
MKVLLTGGGTGGHIYPALAIARRLKELHEDVEILYVGTSRGLESKSVPEAGFAFKAIEMEGFKRELSWTGIRYNLRSIYLFLNGIHQCKKIIKEFKPDIVLGTGGYVAAPVCFAASVLNIPTIIHEQNSVLGLTNKFLAHFVNKICICFPDIYDQLKKHVEKIEFTGNPRAQEVVDAKESFTENESLPFPLDRQQPTVLIVGGSRGARHINEAFIEAYHLFANVDYQVIFVTGQVHYEEVLQELKETQPIKDDDSIVIVPYIEDMVHILGEVDLIVTRSGATTIAEITALGLPAILIPSPYVTADHQTQNASSLVKNDAARLIKEQDLTAFDLFHQVSELMNDRKLRTSMSEAARELGRPDAADHVIAVMLDELNK